MAIADVQRVYPRQDFTYEVYAIATEKRTNTKQRVTCRIGAYPVKQIRATITASIDVPPRQERWTMRDMSSAHYQDNAVYEAGAVLLQCGSDNTYPETGSLYFFTAYNANINGVKIEHMDAEVPAGTSIVIKASTDATRWLAISEDDFTHLFAGPNLFVLVEMTSTADPHQTPLLKDLRLVVDLDSAAYRGSRTIETSLTHLDGLVPITPLLADYLLPTDRLGEPYYDPYDTNIVYRLSLSGTDPGAIVQFSNGKEEAHGGGDVWLEAEVPEYQLSEPMIVDVEYGTDAVLSMPPFLIQDKTKYVAAIEEANGNAVVFFVNTDGTQSEVSAKTTETIDSQASLHISIPELIETYHIWRSPSVMVKGSCNGAWPNMGFSEYMAPLPPVIIPDEWTNEITGETSSLSFISYEINLISIKSEDSAITDDYFEIIFAETFSPISYAYETPEEARNASLTIYAASSYQAYAGVGEQNELILPPERYEHNRIQAFRSGIGDNDDLLVRSGEQTEVDFDYSVFARGTLASVPEWYYPKHDVVYRLRTTGFQGFTNNNQYVEYQVKKYPQATIDYTVHGQISAPNMFEWKLFSDYVVMGESGIPMSEVYEQWTQFDLTPSSDTLFADWIYDSAKDQITNRHNQNGVSGFYNPADISQTDYSFRISAYTSDSDDDMMGVCFRLQDQNNFYSLELQCNGEGGWVNTRSDGSPIYMGLYKWVGGTKTLLAEGLRPHGWYRGQWNNLSVQVVGNRIIIHVDGELQFDYRDNDSPFLNGAYGPISCSQPGTTFANFELRAIVATGTIETEPQSATVLQEESPKQLTTVTAAELLEPQRLQAAAQHGVSPDSISLVNVAASSTNQDVQLVIAPNGDPSQQVTDGNACVYAISLRPTTYTGSLRTQLDPITFNDGVVELLPPLINVEMFDSDGNQFNPRRLNPDEYDDADILREHLQCTFTLVNHGTAAIYFESTGEQTTNLIDDFPLALTEQYEESPVQRVDGLDFGEIIQQPMPQFASSDPGVYMLEKVGGNGNAVCRFQGGTNDTSSAEPPTTEAPGAVIELFIPELQQIGFPYESISSTYTGVVNADGYLPHVNQIPFDSLNIPSDVVDGTIIIEIVSCNTEDGGTSTDVLSATFANTGSASMTFSSAASLSGTNLPVQIISYYQASRNRSRHGTLLLVSGKASAEAGITSLLKRIDISSEINKFLDKPTFLVQASHPAVKAWTRLDGTDLNVYATLPYNSIHPWHPEIHAGYYYFNEEERYFFASPRTIHVNGDPNEPFYYGTEVHLLGIADITTASYLTQKLSLSAEELMFGNAQSLDIVGGKEIVLTMRDNQYATMGNVVSPELVLQKQPIRMLPVELEADILPGTDAYVQVRFSQNRLWWGPWSSPLHNGDEVDLDVGQYMQIRLVLTSAGDYTPVVRRLTLSYVISDQRAMQDEFTDLVQIEVPSDLEWHRVLHIASHLERKYQLEHAIWRRSSATCVDRNIQVRTSGMWLEARTCQPLEVTKKYRRSMKNHTVELPSVPAQGAPIIVESPLVPSRKFRKVVFTDQDGKPTLTYTMQGEAHGKRLYLHHSDVRNVVVRQGDEVITDFIAYGNVLERKAGWDGRYAISYELAHSYYLAEQDGRPILVFTQNYDELVITYEASSDNGWQRAEHLALNPLYNPNNEGFIYLTDTKYPPVRVQVTLTPNTVQHNSGVPLRVIVTVLDRNENPVPNEIVSLSFATTTLYGQTDSFGQTSFLIRQKLSKGDLEITAACRAITATVKARVY